MRYHIDTIPVWDAVKANTECPLCALKRKTERLLVARSLGGSVMSPDTRKKVNERGFCTRHQALLYTAPKGNRLGHALMTLSHLQTQRESILGHLFGREDIKEWRGGLFQALARHNRNGARPITAANVPSCLLCEDLHAQSLRQTASLLHLYKTDAAFRDAFLQSKGLCVPHCGEAMAMADDFLAGGMKKDFILLLKSRLESSLARLETELERYTRKFDYRNADEPWGDARDALERAVNKLQGWCLGNEPLQDEDQA